MTSFYATAQNLTFRGALKMLAVFRIVCDTRHLSQYFEQLIIRSGAKFAILQLHRVLTVCWCATVLVATNNSSELIVLFAKIHSSNLTVVVVVATTSRRNKLFWLPQLSRRTELFWFPQISPQTYIHGGIFFRQVYQWVEVTAMTQMTVTTS